MVILIAERFGELVASVTREKLEPPVLASRCRGFAQGAKNAKFSFADAQIGKRKKPISFAEGTPEALEDERTCNMR